MYLEFSTFRQDAKVVVEDLEFEVMDGHDIRAFLRLPDFTVLAADVGISGMHNDPWARRYPGLFRYDNEFGRPPFLLGGKELWGQSLLRPGATHRTPGGTLLALWAWDPASNAHAEADEMKNGSVMPQRRAVLDLRRVWGDGMDDHTAAFVARMAHQVDISWPLRPNTDRDVAEPCRCGRDHYAPGNGRQSRFSRLMQSVFGVGWVTATKRIRRIEANQVRPKQVPAGARWPEVGTRLIKAVDMRSTNGHRHMTAASPCMWIFSI